jgi:hypothetical protein
MAHGSGESWRDRCQARLVPHHVCAYGLVKATWPTCCIRRTGASSWRRSPARRPHKRPRHACSTGAVRRQASLQPGLPIPSESLNHFVRRSEPACLPQMPNQLNGSDKPAERSVRFPCVEALDSEPLRSCDAGLPESRPSAILGRIAPTPRGPSYRLCPMTGIPYGMLTLIIMAECLNEIDISRTYPQTFGNEAHHR